MSLSQKWGPQVFYYVNDKSRESFSRESSASVPLEVRQASSRTILFLNNDSEVLAVRQSNVLHTFGPFPEIEEAWPRV